MSEPMTCASELSFKVSADLAIVWGCQLPPGHEGAHLRQFDNHDGHPSGCLFWNDDKKD